MSREARTAIAIAVGAALFVALFYFAGSTEGIYLHSCQCVRYGWSGGWRTGGLALAAVGVFYLIGVVLAWIGRGE